MAADPSNRGAWHLWALSESDPRGRVRRWQQVSERFPGDDLALAATADNAASVAGAEHDYQMLDFAIETYERLLDRSSKQLRFLVAIRGEDHQRTRKSRRPGPVNDRGKIAGELLAGDVTVRIDHR